MDLITVFVNEEGKFGNRVGILVDKLKSISSEARQKMATQSGLSEVVFINNIESNQISIFSPTREIPFAGHAVIETVYYLNKIKKGPTSSIFSMGSMIVIMIENSRIWVQAELSKMPKWNFQELETIDEVEKLTIEKTQKLEHCFVWS